MPSASSATTSTPLPASNSLPRMNDNRCVGEDFVFSLPKDVGAYIMLLPPDERDALLEQGRLASRSGHAP